MDWLEIDRILRKEFTAYGGDRERFITFAMTKFDWSRSQAISSTDIFYEEKWRMREDKKTKRG